MPSSIRSAKPPSRRNMMLICWRSPQSSRSDRRMFSPENQFDDWRGFPCATNAQNDGLRQQARLLLGGGTGIVGLLYNGPARSAQPGVGLAAAVEDLGRR